MHLSMPSTLETGGGALDLAFETFLEVPEELTTFMVEENCKL